MNDSLYEQLVSQKPKITSLLIRILTVIVVAAVAMFGMLFLGFFAVLLAIALAFAAYYLLFPRLSVEYEYVLLNHDMEIAAIYSKEKRKELLSFDIREAEIIAPSGSPRLNSYRPAKTYNYTSGNPDAKLFSVMIFLNKQLCCILMEPDETMISHMQGWMGSKMFIF